MTDIIIKIAAVLAVLAALFFGEQYIEGRGYDRAKAEDTAAQKTKELEAADLLASDRRQQRQFSDRAAGQHLAEVERITNQLGVAREKIAHLSGRVCLDSSTVGVLNDVGTTPGDKPSGATAGGAESASSTVATDQDVSEFIAVCKSRYAAVSDQLNKILDIEDRRYPPVPIAKP